MTNRGGNSVKVAKSKSAGVKRRNEKTGVKAWRFFWVGTALTLFDYAIYEALELTLFQGENAGMASVISGTVATVAAFFAHSRITWKARKVGKPEIIKFFAWNALTMWVIRPLLTRGAEFLEPLYQFTYGISGFLRLPFNLEFVRTTGIFVICTAVIMILNFLFYEKLVFGKKK